MTLQMDDNKKFTPSDWLLIQKNEFDKESNIRMSMSYGSNLGEQLLKNRAKVEPATLPSGIRRLPENGELPGISKGWCSRVYRNLEFKRPEVHTFSPEASASPESKPAPAARPAMDLDKAEEAPRRGGWQAATFSTVGSPAGEVRVPLLARTVVNAPARLDRSRIREAARMPKTSSAASLKRLEDKVFDGCRRTCSSSTIFGS
mmetsp:Transcript_9840/g.23655  ORF Transcript_9840/g.23655 Transcript_9840/m.23655 type:complete len:203 (+) Transcript_9840:83-691(+)